LFLLNNIHDRKYKSIHQIDDVIFDISDTQLSNLKNRDWNDIQPGDIACVVTGSRTISTFYRVKERKETEVASDGGGHLHVITGYIVAKLAENTNMTTLLNKFGLAHPSLKGNKFSIGSNVTNLRDALDALIVKTRDATSTVGKLNKPEE
jgi:hypothetical protein